MDDLDDPADLDDNADLDDLDDLDLADWRERTARLYLSGVDLGAFRAERDAMFASHPQSPILKPDRTGFRGLRYFPANPSAVVVADLRPAYGQLRIDTGGPDGIVTYRRVAVAGTPWGPLTVWWIEAYGGGLFVPFRDGTCGRETYGGGRYLTDTVKGTFGRGLTVLQRDRVRLDFNYAYNPSCAYDDRWACPLAPPENRLDAPIRAGELAYHAPGGDTPGHVAEHAAGHTADVQVQLRNHQKGSGTLGG